MGKRFLRTWETLELTRGANDTEFIVAVDKGRVLVSSQAGTKVLNSREFVKVCRPFAVTAYQSSYITPKEFGGDRRG